MVDMAKRFATFHVESVKRDPTRKTLTIVASTARVDRVGDTIIQEGWQLTEFLKSGVLLYEHDRSEPVGLPLNTRIEGGKLVFEPLFMPEEINPFAARVGRMYEGGWLKSVSVGFTPLEMEPRADGRGYIIKRAELLEISCVTIPANPDALVTGKSLPVFRSDGPFSTREARTKGVDAAKVAEFMKGKTMEDELVERVIARLKVLGTIKDEQPASGAAAIVATEEPEPETDTEEDTLALAIAETEVLIAEAESEEDEDYEA
jgi:HK97 family phage prohead protease